MMDAVKATVLQENKKIKMTIMALPWNGPTYIKSNSSLTNDFGGSADHLLAVKNVKRAELVGLLQ